MKKLSMLLILCCFVSYSQTDLKEKGEFRFKMNFRLQPFYPLHFGNTALAKAHKPRVGTSLQFNLFDYSQFKAGFGFDFMTYDITNQMVIGNLSTSKYTSAYYIISYEHSFTEKIFISPLITYGSSSLDLGSRNSRFGKQKGNEFRIGATVDYKIGNGVFISAGMNYVNNKFQIKTSPEYIDFFSKANQIQCNFGIRFGN